MKLIIDIQDFVYNHIKEFNSTQLYELNVITVIKNGTPLEEIKSDMDVITELEKIKAEIEKLEYLNIEDGSDGYDKYIKQSEVLNIIDKYKTESEE